MTDKLELAKKTMESAHDGQKRWDGRPYSVHPISVVKILRQFGVIDEDVLTAGFLHDILEDSKVFTENDIKQTFGDRASKLVRELTFRDSKDNDNIYYEQCMNLSKTARLIKIADILANITDDGHKSDHFIRKRVNALKILLGDQNE